MMDIVAEYNNRAMVPDHPRIISGWNSDAESYRQTANCDLDIAYGARPRNRYDVFRPETGGDGPLVLFIHGGYWRAFDRSVFSHMAKGANAHGLTVAIPSYTLCPETTVSGIIDELRQCCVTLHQRFGGQVVVVGHSAGGHLAACMAATDWELYGLGRGFIKSGLAVSGLFDLRPLMVTPYNDDLKLTPVEAMTASPLFWPVPRPLPFDNWVGGDESFEFRRQARSLAAAWTGLGLDAPYEVVPGENHFSVIGALADPQSAMTRRLVALARA